MSYTTPQIAINKACNNSLELFAIKSSRCKTEQCLIGILIIVDKRSNAFEDDYEVARNSLTCYAKLHTYPLDIIYISEQEHLAKLCPQKDIMLQRHCIAAQYVTKYEWTLFLDADIGVINPNHAIEEYIDESVNIIFYDRFYNWEVMAGSYLVKNSTYSIQFLQEWANFYYRLPLSFHGTDNGVIHIVLMEQLAPLATKERELCERIMNTSTDSYDLFSYEACARMVLGANRHWPGKVKIVPKGLAWARDGWITNTKFCERDFMFHGWKKSKLDQEWTMPLAKPNALFRCTTGFAAFATYCDYKMSVAKIDVILEKKYIEVEWDFLETVGNLKDRLLE